MSAPHRGATLLAAGLLTFLSGCSVEPAATSTTVEPDLIVSMFEWGFGPSTSTAEARSGTVLRLRNDGRLRHDWALLSTPIESEAELRPDRVIASARVEPGAIEILEFVTPGGEIYQIICSIAGHFSQGMEGSLVVAP